uniref:Pentatricopeptide repeat-containing protein n=1 Tax=Tanacetum cinerariifolium TaxID=118510 RepID=A0A6L2KJ80_TANCI|nr:hypothetical protein [Tanacetum cinerariifolium]
MPQRDVVSCNMMIFRYSLSGDEDGAVEMFEEMQGYEVKPSSVMKRGMVYRPVIVGNSLIDMYSIVFKELDMRDSTVCNSVTSSFTNHQLKENAMQIFTYSSRKNARPDDGSGGGGYGLLGGGYGV